MIMALEIQNSSEENKKIIEEVQNNVEKDKQILQDLITCGEKLDEEAHKAFNKKPRSNIQEEQANIIEEVQNIVQKDKMNKTVCIWITIIAIIMTIVIVIVYFTTSLSSNILDSSTTRISTTESGQSGVIPLDLKVHS